MARVLIVEDDPAMSDVLNNYMQFEQHQVECASNGADGLQLLQGNSFDLAIVDWTLPSLSGVELVRRYRSGGGKAMILMLTGRNAVQEKSLGLESGADDYLTKPFHTDELTARVRALLRRLSTYSSDDTLRCGELTLNLNQHTTTVNDAELNLIPKEFAVLEMLMRYPGRVFTLEEIIARIWENEEAGSIDAVRTHVKNLRKKISVATEHEYIETVHGIGYKVRAKK